LSSNGKVEVPPVEHIREKVVWGAPSFWIERFPLYVGREMGFFQNQGIDIEIWYSYGGPELARAMAAGDIHIGEMGLPPFIKAYTHGLPAKVIASSPIQQLDHYLVARPDIDGISNLAGRRIGILSFGSCDDYFIRHILKSGDMDLGPGAELVPLGESYGDLRVFSSGKVDAAFMVEPRVSEGETRGLLRIIGRVGDYFPRYQWGVILASVSWLQDRKELIRQLMAAYRRACRWIHENPEDTVELGSKVFEVRPGVFRKALLRDLNHWQIDARLDKIGMQNALDIQNTLGLPTSDLCPENLVCQM